MFGIKRLFLDNILVLTFQNGFLSSLPYLLMWLLSSPVGMLADYLIVSGKMKVNIFHVFISELGWPFKIDILSVTKLCILNSN